MHILSIHKKIAGGVPKRSTGADCKSAGLAYVGSNPTPSTIVENFMVYFRAIFTAFRCAGFRLFLSQNDTKSYSDRGCSSMVEPQPSKLLTAVRFRSPAPYTDFLALAEKVRLFFCHLRARSFRLLAHIAQSVEYFLGKEEVTGSNPVMGSRFIYRSDNASMNMCYCPSSIQI